MKSADIAQMQAAEQADWKARGVGRHRELGRSGDAARSRSRRARRKMAINTSSKTEFKRFAGDSVKYQDAKPGTLAQIQPKDQLQARGAKSADGTSMQAEEVVSGSFENLSGLIASVDPAAGKITLKDLATKKVVTVNVTANSDIRSMPAQVATMFAARTNGGGGGGGRRRRRRRGRMPAGAAAGGRCSAALGGRGPVADDSRFPAITLADLHKGDAVMIVASERRRARVR